MIANWCTSKEETVCLIMLKKKPNGKLSDIYIIINNDFFTGKSDEIYQIHFESGQIKDRLNSGNVSILNSVIEKVRVLKISSLRNWWVWQKIVTNQLQLTNI
jgi:hypothetical protein